jgi:hypothetical protein
VRRIEGSGELTERDYVRAMWLHLRPRPLFAVFGVVLLAAFALALLHTAVELVRGERLPTEYLVPAAAMAGAVVWMYRAWIGAIRRHPLFRGTYRLVLTDEGIISELSERASSECRWDVYTAWREGPDVFVLYSGPQNLQVFPKRWFGEEGARQVRSLLESLPLSGPNPAKWARRAAQKA